MNSGLRLPFLTSWVVVLMVFAFSPTMARKYDEVIESGYVLIGIYRDFPPYSYLDSKGQPAGIDVDLGKKIALRLGVNPRWYWITADENMDDDLRNAVWKGHFLTKKIADFMMRVPFERELERRNQMIALFAPYQAEMFLMAYDIRKIPEFQNYAIFQYENIALQLDTLPDFMMTGMYNGRLAKKIIRFLSQSEANKNLINGESAATIGLSGPLLNELSGNQNIRFLIPPMQEITRPQKVLNCPDIKKDWTSKVQIEVQCKWEYAQARTEWDIGIAVMVDFRQLGYAVEIEIEQLIKDGVIGGIFSNHGVNYRLPLFLSEQN